MQVVSDTSKLTFKRVVGINFNKIKLLWRSNILLEDLSLIIHNKGVKKADSFPSVGADVHVKILVISFSCREL